MTSIAIAINSQQKSASILPSFRRHTLIEGIIKSDKGIKVEKEKGYIRCYYPASEMIEEISSNGTKVRFSFNMNEFRKLENKNPRAAAIFYRYNAELFGSVSCSMSYLVRLYGSTAEQIGSELCTAEREVLKIIDINQ